MTSWTGSFTIFFRSYVKKVKRLVTVHIGARDNLIEAIEEKERKDEEKRP